MPSIRPISDLRNSANDISDFCRQSREPVYITRNGTGDMVVMNIEEYERQMALIDLYGKLAVAEAEISSGAVGEDFYDGCQADAGAYPWNSMMFAFSPLRSRTLWMWSIISIPFPKKRP